MPPHPTSSGDLKPLRKRLLHWYRRNKRGLPWRNTGNPYRILVSEIMLQQTQVVTVIPYYRRFIKTYPTVASLAKAPLQKVLKLWEGLGYYSRARNLRRAAQVIRDQWKGHVPDTLEGLVSLPGIGRYTAGAIASIAFGLKAPILDGNVRRVLCRIFLIRKDPRLGDVQARLWRLAAEILPEQNVGDFNQALMELGATICLPKTPECPRCPVSESCRAYRAGLQNLVPVRVRKPPIPHHKRVVALIENGRGILMGPRPERGLLAGMWSFPELTWSKEATSKQIENSIEDQLGLKTRLLRPLEPVAHTFSHKRITYHPLRFECLSEPNKVAGSWRWISITEIDNYPLPNAARKIINQLSLNISEEDSLPLAAEPPAEYRTPNILSKKRMA